MAITKEKKKEIHEKLDGIVKDAETLVFVGFSGLSGGEVTMMRRALRENGVGYVVTKKTLMNRVLTESPYQGERPALEGEVAIAYGVDAIQPAQSIRDFQKQFEDRVRILGGVFAGTYKNQEEMTEIASIPSMQTLRGMFVNVINSPIQGLAISLSQIAEKRT